MCSLSLCRTCASSCEVIWSQSRWTLHCRTSLRMQSTDMSFAMKFSARSCGKWQTTHERKMWIAAGTCCASAVLLSLPEGHWTRYGLHAQLISYSITSEVTIVESQSFWLSTLRYYDCGNENGTAYKYVEGTYLPHGDVIWSRHWIHPANQNNSAFYATWTLLYGKVVSFHLRWATYYTSACVFLVTFYNLHSCQKVW